MKKDVEQNKDTMNPTEGIALNDSAKEIEKEQEVTTEVEEAASEPDETETKSDEVKSDEAKSDSADSDDGAADRVSDAATDKAEKVYDKAEKAYDERRSHIANKDDGTFTPLTAHKKEPNMKLMFAAIGAALLALVIFIGVLTRRPDASNSPAQADTGASIVTAEATTSEKLERETEITYEDDNEPYGFSVKEGVLYWEYNGLAANPQFIKPEDASMLGLETVSSETSKGDEGAMIHNTFLVYPIKEGKTRIFVIDQNDTVNVPVTVEVTEEKMFVHVGTNEATLEYSASFSTETEKNLDPILGLKSGDKIPEPEALEREGYQFIGWMEPQSTRLWDFEKDRIDNRNVHLMAVWVVADAVQPVPDIRITDDPYSGLKETVGFEGIVSRYGDRATSIAVESDVFAVEDNVITFSYNGETAERYKWKLDGAAGAYEAREKHYTQNGKEMVADRAYFYPKKNGTCLVSVLDSDGILLEKVLIVIDDDSVTCSSTEDDTELQPDTLDRKISDVNLDRLTKFEVTINVGDEWKKTIYEKDGFLIYEGYGELYDSAGVEHLENVYYPEFSDKGVTTYTTVQDLVYQRGGMGYLKEIMVIYAEKDLTTRMKIVNADGDVAGSFLVEFDGNKITVDELK